MKFKYSECESFPGVVRKTFSAHDDEKGGYVVVKIWHKEDDVTNYQAEVQSNHIISGKTLHERFQTINKEVFEEAYKTASQYVNKKFQLLEKEEKA